MSINVTELLVKTLENACKDLVNRAVTECADKYKFDANEAIKLLGTEKISINAKKMIRGPVSKNKDTKDTIPMPFMADHVNMECCQGLRFNHGLFTQCNTKKMNASEFCKTCQIDADKNANGKPTCGTVQNRIDMADNFLDVKGRKPKNYALVLKKLKIDVEDAIRHAQGKNLDITHLLTQTPKKTKNNDHHDNNNNDNNKNDNDKKRGRPRKQPMEVESVTDMFAVYAQQKDQTSTTDHTLLTTTHVTLTETTIDDNNTNTTNNHTNTTNNHTNTTDTALQQLKLSDEDKLHKKEQLKIQKALEKEQKEAKKIQEKNDKEAKKIQDKEANKKNNTKKNKDNNKDNKDNNKDNKDNKDTNNANTTDTLTQQVTTAIQKANNTNNNTKIVKVDGQTYTIHLLTNHVYDHNNTHVATFDPNDKSIEFFHTDDDDQEQQQQQQQDKILHDVNL